MPMDTGLPTVGHIIWRWLESQGLDARRIFADHGLSEDDLQPQSRRVPSDTWERIFAAAQERTSDPCAGLNAAKCWHPSDLGALGYAWLASSTLRTGLQRMARYFSVVGQRLDLATRNTAQGLKISLQQKRPDPMLRAVATDFSMSVILDMCRTNFRVPLNPVEVTLRRPPPDCAGKYEEMYHCPVNYSDAEDGFTLAIADADRPLPTSNRQLAGVHDEILTQQLAALHRVDIVARCKTIILQNLTSGEISAEMIARELHMSPRTLTRRMESQGAQLQKLVDETRRELAERYFADPANSVSEVAFLLGFSQQSSLSRASNRWFGMPPQKYRSKRVGRSADAS